jgi:hypothetical protein
MINEREIKSLGIINWSEVHTNSNTILLGNGFSMNFYDKLNYSNLYDFSKNLFTKKTLNLFNEFETNNFEDILEYLFVTKKVSSLFNIDNNELDEIISEVQNGLINSIHQIHPKPNEIDYYLINRIGKQLSNFKNVFTTNYDLFLYYVTLNSPINYSDHFYQKVSDKFIVFSKPDIQHTHHVYYLHGSLILFDEIWETYKICKYRSTDLIELISEQILDNSSLLFVSEGNSNNKLKKIYSNDYLKFCFNELKNLDEEDIIIYGQSLKEQDNHLVELIDNKFKNVYISIKIFENSTYGTLRSEISKIQSRFRKSNLFFFNSETLFDFN